MMWIQEYDVDGLRWDATAYIRNVKGHTKGLLGQEEEVFHIDNENNVIAFHRWAKGGPGDSIVVAANFSTQPCKNYSLPMPATGEWIVRFNSDSSTYNDEFGNFGDAIIYAGVAENESLPAKAKINVAPYSAIIMSQGKNDQ